MMKSMILFQPKPMTIKVLGVFLLFLLMVVIYEGSSTTGQSATIFVLGLMLLGYSVAYELRSDFNHLKHFKLFGITCYKTKLRFFQPEKAKAFPVLTKRSFDWGPVSAMGKRSDEKHYVIRLFNGNQHFTVFRNGSLEEVKGRGQELSSVLGVAMEIRDQ